MVLHGSPSLPGGQPAGLQRGRGRRTSDMSKGVKCIELAWNDLGFQACFTRALLHSAGRGLPDPVMDLPNLQLSFHLRLCFLQPHASQIFLERGARSSQHFSFLEMQDFCRYLPAGSTEGTLVRRSLARSLDSTETADSDW